MPNRWRRLSPQVNPAAEAGWSANKTWIGDAQRVALFRLEPPG